MVATRGAGSDFDDADVGSVDSYDYDHYEGEVRAGHVCSLQTWRCTDSDDEGLKHLQSPPTEHCFLQTGWSTRRQKTTRTPGMIANKILVAERQARQERSSCNPLSFLKHEIWSDKDNRPDCCRHDASQIHQPRTPGALTICPNPEDFSKDLLTLSLYSGPKAEHSHTHTPMHAHAQAQEQTNRQSK